MISSLNSLLAAWLNLAAFLTAITLTTQTCWHKLCRGPKGLILTYRQPLAFLRILCPMKIWANNTFKCLLRVTAGLSNLYHPHRVNMILCSTAITTIRARRSLPMAALPNSSPYISIQTLAFPLPHRHRNPLVPLHRVCLPRIPREKVEQPQKINGAEILLLLVRDMILADGLGLTIAYLPVARFRTKKKQRSLNLERSVSDLTGRAEELEREASELRKENVWLKEIVILKGRSLAGTSRDEGGSRNRGDDDSDSDSDQSDSARKKKKGKGRDKADK